MTPELELARQQLYSDVMDKRHFLAMCHPHSAQLMIDMLAAFGIEDLREHNIHGAGFNVQNWDTFCVVALPLERITPQDAAKWLRSRGVPVPDFPGSSYDCLGICGDFTDEPQWFGQWLAEAY